MKKPAKILVGAVMVIALLASLQGCETMAKLARSKTGRVMILSLIHISEPTRPY